MDVLVEYRLADRTIRRWKSVHKAFAPTVGDGIALVINPDAPRHAMLLLNLRARMLKP